jgi:hypothetical protein
MAAQRASGRWSVEMLRLLQLIFLGHIHKWKIIKENPLIRRDIDTPDQTGINYVLQCEHCGTLKQFDTV